MSQKRCFAVGGIWLNVFLPLQDGAQSKPGGPVAVLFLLHGRLSKSDVLEATATKLVEYEGKGSTSEETALELVVVTFDLRNHGVRIVDPRGNQGWGPTAEENNARHAIDMFSIISGTYRDISFLIDFLPSYLFPCGERVVERWMLAGISLGGHATWYALQHEPRLSVGIPIIGCPDYFALMNNRARVNDLEFKPPLIPNSLLQIIEKESPLNTSATSGNPFLGKRILVLAGGKDDLVPWVFSESFVGQLEVGGTGVKKVIVYPDVGHAFTSSMEEDLADFVWKERRYRDQATDTCNSHSK